MANRFNYSGGDQDSWLEQAQEPIIEPNLSIVDAHHHLWIRDDIPYLLREFANDLNSGHRVIGSVFAECHSMYRTTGPSALRPAGEMEFIAGINAMSASGAFNAPGVCHAAVGGVDLSLGSAVEAPLQAMLEASGGRCKGVRASICWDTSDRLHRATPLPHYFSQPQVLAALEVLQRMHLSLDCWLYHPQIPELTEVAKQFPALRIILNHSGTPILGGPYKDDLISVRADWLASLTVLAEHDQVFMKLGALPARFHGENAANKLPPTSEDIAASWREWIEPCIELFGAQRCMFESNFPVHKNWMSYANLWNAFKRIAQGASAADKQMLFAGTAITAYSMDDLLTTTELT